MSLVRDFEDKLNVAINQAAQYTAKYEATQNEAFFFLANEYRVIERTLRWSIERIKETIG